MTYSPKSVLFAALLLSLPAGASLAAPASPVDVTGFDEDVVAETLPAFIMTSRAIDDSDYVLFVRGLNGPTEGLPTSGVIATGDVTYQLKPYSVVNAVVLDTGASRVLTLTTPERHARLAFLLLSTDGDASLQITVNFTDASSAVFTTTVTDWYAAGGGVLNEFGAVNRVLNIFRAPVAGRPAMHQFIASLTPSDQMKQVQSIQVANTSVGAGHHLTVLAVSGEVATAPAPVPTLSEYGLGALAALLLAGTAWMLNRRRPDLGAA